MNTEHILKSWEIEPKEKLDMEKIIFWQGLKKKTL